MQRRVRDAKAVRVRCIGGCATQGRCVRNAKAVCHLRPGIAVTPREGASAIIYQGGLLLRREPHRAPLTRTLRVDRTHARLVTCRGMQRRQHQLLHLQVVTQRHPPALAGVRVLLRAVRLRQRRRAHLHLVLFAREARGGLWDPLDLRALRATRGGAEGERWLRRLVEPVAVEAPPSAYEQAMARVDGPEDGAASGHPPHPAQLLRRLLSEASSVAEGGNDAQERDDQQRAV